MRNYLSNWFRGLLLAALLMLCGQGAYANHIVGMDLNYTWVSGNTYKITLVAYGDCGDVGGAFAALPTATPQIGIFNTGTYVACFNLAIESPSSGVRTTPVCVRDTDSTTCTSLSYSIPGIKKFTYSGNYTFPSTSHCWQIVFNGYMSTSSFAGRQSAITNIVFTGFAGSSVMALVDTLDNTYYNNSSVVLRTPPTPYYCASNSNNYNPDGLDPNGDSLVYYLVAGKMGPYPTAVCSSFPSTLVTYTGTAWGSQPICDTTPLVVTAGSWGFDPASGHMSFIPSSTQRGLVVYNVREYRHDTFMGSSQREMVFLVQTCRTAPPTAIMSGATAGVISDSTHFRMCQGSGSFSFNINPTMPDTSLRIKVSTRGLPAGSSFVVTGDSTNAPTCVFSWTSTGVAPGTYVFYVTFKDNNCPISASNTIAFSVIITPPPSIITGNLSVCVGSTTALADSVVGGRWSSSNTGIATIGSISGVATGVAAGTTIITYSIGAGCQRTTTLTVNPLPSPISGSLGVCVGLTTTLTDAGGGTWLSSRTAVATIGSSTGVVTALTVGTTIITYALPTGCRTVATVTVNPLPGPIAGLTAVCVGQTITLVNTGGGTWSSSAPGVASIGVSTGIVFGLSAGTTVITYTLPTTCRITTTITVNPLPGVITGVNSVCEGGYTSTLSDATPGGTWTSSDMAVAMIDLATGVVTGMSAGTSIITYTVSSTGCYATRTFTVYPSPDPITGVTSLCQGYTSLLTDAGGGTWSSSNTAVAPIGSTSGIVSGLTLGTATITYRLPTGCYITTPVVVNPLPGPISGASAVCVGSTTTWTDPTPSGDWSSSNIIVAPVLTPAGVVIGSSAGTAVITYTLTTGCYVTGTVTVVSPPTAITGTPTVCVGGTTTLSNAVPGGTWTSSNLTRATVGSTTGVVTGVSAGTSIITYSIAAGCYATRAVTVTPAPAAITGGSSMCVGGFVILADLTPGGAWTSCCTGTATIVGGTVTGVAAGTAVITYATGPSCFVTKIVTVQPTPTTITGATSVCIGFTTTLGNTVSGGTWTSSNTAVATIGSTTGIVNGLIAGTSIITYSLPSGCSRTTVVTVNPNPGTITGSLNVCIGLTSTLGNSVAGGVWTSTNTGVATIGSSSGLVSGITAGTTTISYTLSTGCFVTAVVTVNLAPGPITGPTTVCSGATITEVNSITGGSWSSSNTAVATVGSLTGDVLGVTGGTSVITYSLGAGCISTRIITVFTSPTAISGPTALCVGATITCGNGTPGGTWTSTNTAVATIGSVSGIVNGVALGTTIITYIVPGGCYATTTVAVSPTPGPILGSPTVCIGIPTAYTNSVPGGLWTSSSSTVSVGSTSGLVTGVSVGTAMLTYSLGSGCTAYRTVTVIPSPSAITGPTSVCVGSTIICGGLPGGGTWSSSDIAVATIGTSGTVTGVAAGTATITYTAANGCYALRSITVNPLPAAISGITSMCVGASTTLSDATSGGLWSSSNTAIARVGSVSGVVTGVSSGTATITYTSGAGCYATILVTVTPTPAPIGGVPVTGIGSSTTLTNLIPGGIWTISDIAIATVGSLTGVVTGISYGTAVVTYAIGACSVTQIVTVTYAATPISGPTSLCTGLCYTLTDGVGGGTWSSTNPAVATIGSSTGLVCGVTPGTAVITYSIGTGPGLTVFTTVTVSPSPAPITGPTVMCVGGTITVSDPTPTGRWTSGDPAVATVGFTSGVVTGVSAGTAMITYAISTCYALRAVTVNPTPGPITGVSNVCQGSTTTLGNSVSGGIWTSGSPTIATIGSSTGVVTGILPGASIITYSFGGLCIATRTVTVQPITPIYGTPNVCVGYTASLFDGTPGGTWSSLDPAVATVGIGTGVITGVSAGTSIITYSLPTGCNDTIIVTVYPVPVAITGPSSVCQGSTITLTDGTPGGGWSSSNALVATIGGTSGLLTGVGVGTAVITYSISGGCRATTIITVNPLPLPISGPASSCVGSSVGLSSLTPGGSWSIADTTVARIGGTSGIVTGVNAGATVVTYTLSTGCYITRGISINPVPNPISGVGQVCVGQTAILSDGTPGGSWSSSAPAIGTVGAVSGVVGGISAGITVIDYTLPTGCSSQTTFTVVPIPTPITGPGNLCVGATITLADAVPGGIWYSGNPGIGAIGSTTGVVSGISSGTVLISYALGTGCMVYYTVIVNPLSPITGPSTVCERQRITLTDTTEGGTWTSSNPAVATVVVSGDSTATVSGIAPGLVTITYTLPTGCVTYKVVRVLPAPPPVTGPGQVCVGQSITLGNPIFGGTWTVDSPAIAIVGFSSGVVTGMSAGTAIVSYTLGGCPSTRAITVNPLPATITGSPNVCVGLSTLLSSATPGGTWSSSRPATATIGVSSGLVTGVTAGTAVITYRIVTGCYTTMVVNVDPAPAPITGSHNVCLGLSTPLADATFGGGWSSSNGLVAPVDAFGTVYGVALGTATITYTIGTGCYVTFDVTVNNLPAPITGPSDVCVGQSITLADASPGGSWVSGDVAIATAGSSTGVITGVSAGVVPITYTLGTGCIATTNILVNPLPAPIVGGTQVCERATLALYSAPGGGGWGSSNTTVATVDASTGVVTGVSAGTATITYAAGCYTTITITVNRMPSAIGGNPIICLGSTNVLTDSVAGGTWTSSTPAVAPVTVSTGRVTGLSLGTSEITYSLGAGCEVTKTVAVVPLPVVYNVSGTDSFCAGGAGVHLYLSGSQVGVNYLLYLGSTATGTFAGTGSGLDFGAQTVGGTYHVVAISASSGCSATMAGTATITVNPTVRPTVNITATGGSDTICAGASTIYTAIPTNGGSAPTYVWTVNGTTVGAGTTYSFIPADGDVIKVVVTSNARCAIPDTGSISKRITVSANQNPVVNILTAPGDTVCKGMAIHLTASPVWGGYTPSLVWRKFGLNVSAGPTYSYIPDDGDVVTCFMTSNYPCLSVDTVTSPALQVRVVEPQLPEVLITAAPDYHVGTGRMVTLTAVVTNGGLHPTYQWLINGVPITGATNVTYSSNTFHNTFQDSVTCMVTSSGVCPTQGFGWAYINVNDVSVISVSGGGNVSVLPNPSKGTFNVKGNIGAALSATIEVTDMLGRVVYSRETSVKNGELNTQVQLSRELSNGMYLLNLHTDQGSKVFHIVLER